MATPKKQHKTQAKLEKKRLKAESKDRKNHATEAGDTSRPSPAVRYAESVRGIVSILTGVSLLVALLLGHQGVIVSLDDLINSLFAARAGKILLALIGLAMLIYGMKYLRLVR